MGIKVWSTVLKAIFDFMGATPNNVPALYTDRKQIASIQSFFKFFCADANEETEFRIYPSAELFFKLKQESCKYSLEDDGGFPTIHIADAVLCRDEYDYRSGIACNVCK